VAGALLGVGNGTVYPALLAMTLDLTGPEERGAAMGTFGIGMDIGIGLGSIVLGVVIEMVGFPVAFAMAGGVPIAMLATYGAVTRLRRPSEIGGTGRGGGRAREPLGQPPPLVISVVGGLCPGWQCRRGAGRCYRAAQRA